MPKQKTHKGMSKVFKVRPGGTIKKGKPGVRHNTGNVPLELLIANLEFMQLRLVVETELAQDKEQRQFH